ncbi:MAG: nitric oxide reductase large subunit [SAR86 cluster bacterium]|uniref:Nitric oxide reductase large subunit n=1 Tax=SAR86 cluster bacterium TaxID=2030880 RepID=A0A2A4X0Q9_9GAMM|nr:MAG: nitric oxide reductase large subunit [SAR86 cluster bacterium]
MESYRTTFTVRRLWALLIVSMVIMFSILLYFGNKIYQEAPPIPDRVVSESGTLLFTLEDINVGQNVWQSTGGMQQGSIWGHGSYLAPDWSADWLHREAESLLAMIAERDGGQSSVSEEVRLEQHKVTLRVEMRENRFDPTSGTLTVSDERAAAIGSVAVHYRNLYQVEGADAVELRREYAFPLHSALDDSEAHALTAFYFWTAWAAVTNRPDDSISYTSNWPHDPLVGNTPPASLYMWSFISIFLLLAGIGGLVWYYARQWDIWRDDMEPIEGFAQVDALALIHNTPSMKATAKYFWLVTALFVAQMLLGIVTAHYAVEGQGLYGLPLVDYLPYSITRTWHTQLSVLWIATAWLATGLYVAPLLSGHEPKFQRLGVNFLFVSLLVIVIGSFAGQWLAVHGFIDDMQINFWFGHQGYEYVDLGRFWQIYLFIGLLLWVALVLRAIWPVLRDEASGSLAFLVVVSTASIGLLYGAGLMWGQNTHISIMEYWRWWVVHLWVEGIFEVFATAIIATLFVRMGLLRASVATVSVLFATIIFLTGGVLGTFHHLYFSGTPVSVLALGATFSALEVVPLMVVGFEAYSRAKVEKQSLWEEAYHWPFMFFSAVLIWNMIGAGLFGFLINPPIALYYMQGLNTTANHGHAALFGVYGMLGIGLMLFCMRGLTEFKNWNQKCLKVSFWSLNIGLAMMTFLSLLPQGLWQTYASINEYYALARSEEFMHSALMEGLVWARVPGDIVFAVGVFALALFVFRAFVPSGSVRRSQ